MQKFLVKYGLAVHLAILAVAPLFLLSFTSTVAGARSMLWLSLSAVVWLLLEPSLRHGEHLGEARRRVVRGLVLDPMLWAMLAFAAAAGMCAANGGVSLAYDAENGTWRLCEAAMSILPASVDGERGFFLFASALAAMVAVVGVRQALGRSARTVFLTWLSMLSGIVAIMMLLCGHLGYLDVLSAVRADAASHSYVGLSFGLAFLAGTVAFVGAIERDWYASLPLFVFAVGGTGAGAFCFAPDYMVLAFAAAEAVLVVYAIVFVRKTLQPTAQMKVLLGVLSFVALGGLLAAATLPAAELDRRIEAFQALSFFPDGFWKSREALSRIGLKSWMGNLWIGSGLDSFPIDFRFASKPEDWLAFPKGATGVQNGWWLMLAERGVVGCALFVIPLVILLVSHVLRFVGWFAVRDFPHPACLLTPLALGAALATSFFDSSFMRTDAMAVLLPVLAVSALSFPIAGRGRNG